MPLFEGPQTGTPRLDRSCGDLGLHSHSVEPKLPAVTGDITDKFDCCTYSFGTPENWRSFAGSRLYFSGELLLVWDGVTNRPSLRAASRRKAINIGAIRHKVPSGIATAISVGAMALSFAETTASKALEKS